MADPAFNYALAKEDGFNDEQIASHLAKERDFNIDLAIQDGFDYSQIAQHLATLPPDEKGQFGQIADELQRGAHRVGIDYSTFIKSFADPEEAALTAIRKSEEVAERLGTPPSLEAALQALKDEGAINAAGEVVGDILPALASQLPTIATVVGGRYVGAKLGAGLGAMVGGPPGAAAGAVIGGVVAPFVGLLPQLLSPNMQRQVQTDIEEGREVDIDMSKAYMAATAQTATEQAAIGFILGKRMIGSLLRRPAVRGGDKKAAEALRALANRRLAGNVVRGVGAGASVEMSQEVAQQVMERWQAGLDLTSEEALTEYGEAAYQAALVGGTIRGVTQGIEGKTITPPPDPAQLLEREQQLIEEEARRIDDMVEPPMEDDVALEAWAETYPRPDAAAVPTAEPVPEVDTTTRTLGPRELQVEAETLVRGTSPTQSLTFTSQVLADGSGYQVADQAGNPYGRPVSDMEMGQQLALRMNQVKADQQILNSANDSINLAAGTAPSTSTRKTLLSIGNRVLNPRYNKVTFRELNAAGVVGDPLAEDSRRLAIQNLPLEQAEYYLTQGPERSRAKSRAEMLRIFTPTQRLNYKRRAKGQREAVVFTMAEARTALKNKFGNLANPQVITPKVQERARMEAPSIPISEREAGRQRKTKTLINEGLYRVSEGAPKTVSMADLTKLLLQKNISSPLNSPAMKPLIKAFTGASNANAMTEGDRRVLYKNLNRFQAFEQSTKIPLFTARPFSAEQFSTVVEAVNSTGNMEDSFVAESANISPDNTATIKALQQELRKQRVIVNNKVRAFGQQTAAEADLLLAAPEGYAEEQAATQAEAAVRADRFKLLADLRTALNAYLDKRGLGDVKVRLDEAFEDAIAGNTQGFYDRDLRTVFFALDRIPDAASLTPEQLIASLENIMGHEMVHALRGLDLWTEAEWDSLVNATMQREKSDGETYMKWAVKNYPDKIPSIVEEEAVAEMIRDVIAGKSKVAGKPRNLIQRIFDFFERLANYLKVSQFNTFEEMVDGIIADVEGGVTGARERGVIRTPRRAIEEIESLGREPTTMMDVRAWQGSPSKFDQMSTDYIGTGEGFQAFGWGLYFSQAPEVATGYQKDLTDYTIAFDGKGVSALTPIDQLAKELGVSEADAEGIRSLAQWAYADPTKKGIKGAIEAKKMLLEEYRSYGVSSDSLTMVDLQRAVNAAEKYADKLEDAEGYLYDVELTISEDHLLDWDVPINQQTERVKAKLEPILKEYWTAPSLPINKLAMVKGEDIYRQLAAKMAHRNPDYSRWDTPDGLQGFEDNAQELASKIFNEAGIPGIRYYDAFSRGAQEGTRNFAIFDDSLVEIKARNGEELTPVEREIAVEELTQGGGLAQAVRERADQRIAETKARNVIKIEDIARVLDEEHLATYGRKLDPNVTEDQLIAAQVIADDIKQQMTNDISGQGWYDADVQKAFMLLSEIPNLESLGTNEDNRVIWSAIAGPTSNNQKVIRNTRIATAAMLEYLRTGKIPTVPPAKGAVTEGIPGAGWGSYQKAVASGMQIISKLVEKKGAQGFADWWLSPHTLKELTEIRKEAGLGGPTKGLSGGRDSYHLGAMVIGDKTGRFSLNINGYEGTTKDVWYVRSYNRVFGQMFGNTGDVQGAPRSQTERRQMEAFNRLVIDNIKEEELSEADAQAILWFHEQNLYTELGVESRPESFSEGVEELYDTLEIRQRVRGSDAGQAQVESEDALEGWRGISPAQRVIRSFRRSAQERDSGSYDSRESGPYQRGSVEGYGADGLLSFSPDPAALNTYQAGNLSLPEIEQVDSATNAESYNRDMREAMEGHPKGAQVTIKSPEELAEARLFRTASGSGFAVMPDGDVVAVFASPNEPSRGSYAMLQAAVQAGGTKLDAFNTYLPKIYETVGFRPVARVPWNDEFAPETWDKETFAAYNNGEPDIVFFVHDPDYFGGETNVPTVEKYADAVALQDEALDQVSKPIPAKLTTKPEDAEAVAADESKIADENRADTEADQRANKKIEAVNRLESRTGPPEVTRDVAYTQVANLAAKRAEKGLGDFEDGQVSWETPTDAGKRFKKTGKTGDYLIFQVADKYLDLKRDESAINQAREKAGLPPLNALQSVYKGEESIHGIIAKAFEDVEFDEMRPLLAKMAETGVDLRQMDVFLILRHAIERNAHIRKINNELKGTAEYNPNLEDGGSGSLTIEGVKHRLTDDYVKSVMRNDYGMTWNDSTSKWEGGNSRGISISNLAKDYDEMGRRTLDVYKDSGLISDKDAEFLSSYYTYYAPLRGISPNEDIATDELIRERGTGSANLGIRGKELLTARGRESEAYGPLSTTYAERQRAIVRGAKNVHVGQRLLNLIRANPNPDYWNITTEQKGGERIGVKENGTQYFVDIADPRLRGALLNLDAQQTNVVLGFMRGVNRMLSLVNTSLNPEFVLGNFARDLETAMGNLVGEQSMKGGLALDTKGLKRGVIKDVLPSIGQFYKGIRRSKNLDPKTQKLFDEYRRSGAKTDWYHPTSPTESAKSIETLSQMAQGTFKGNTKAGWAAVTNLVSDVNSAVENGVRFSTFKKAKELFVKNGMPEKLAIAQAATLAKNLTVNFNRKGNSGETLNALYLFFNASVQGTVNFVRGIRSSRKKQALLTAMASWGALLTLINEETSEEDDETGRSYYDDVDDYQKERNMIFMKTMNPFYKGDPKLFYKIPLPYGYNVLHVFGLNVMESLLGHKSKEEAATDLVAAAIGSFAPIGFSSSERGALTRAGMAVVPQIGKPFAEILANENFFGGPIYRENMDFGTQLPRSSLSLTSTPEWLKTTTEFLNEISAIDGHKYKAGKVNISPDQAAHLMRTFTGGSGKFIERSAKSIAALSDYARDEYREGDLSINDIPLLRRVMGEATSRESQSDYYDRRDDIFTMYAYVRSDELKGAERTEYIAKNRDYLRMKGFIDALDKRLSGINKRLRVVTERLLETPSMPITLRLQDEQERLEDLKTQVYDRFNKRFDALIGREK